MESELKKTVESILFLCLFVSVSLCLSLLSFHFGYNIPSMESVLLLNIHLFLTYVSITLSGVIKVQNIQPLSRLPLYPFPVTTLFSTTLIQHHESVLQIPELRQMQPYMCAHLHPASFVESMFLLTDGSCLIVQMYHDVSIHFPKS